MLRPKSTKYKRYHRGKYTRSKRGKTIANGKCALQSTEYGWISARQIEAGRRALTRHAKRGGKVWIRIFPDLPVTARPAETRMGAGKGSTRYWVSVVQPGKIVYEISGVSKQIAQEAMRLASYKMPIKSKVIDYDPTRE
jgi:large subunit ribosomal protein L16